MREDWVECKFEDLLDYEQPTNYIIKEENYSDSFPIPVLTAGKGFIKGYTNEEFGVFNKLPTIIFDDFTTASQYVNFKFKVKSSAMKILNPTSSLVNLKFLFNVMQVCKVRSETHKRYWISEYSQIRFGLPPLPEQRAIVKKIEALFSSLDAGIADLKKAQDQLKIYRQAVLKKAFEGEGEYYNICDVTKDIFAGGDKPTRFSENKNSEFSVPIYANAVANKGLYGYTDLARVNQAAVTIAGRGSGTGHVELREHPYLPIVRLINVIPNEEILDTKYLFYYLKGQNITGTGSAIPQLTIPTVKEYLVFVPSLQEQAQIVKEIETRLSVCDAVEQQIKESLSQAEALRQSILKKAFEGKFLTEAEIQTCKQEPDYEPASVLLEKIKAEKEANKPVKKTKKK